MVSKVEICNYALQELGSGTITSLNEGTAAANECNLRYDSCRRALLSMHQWNFAIRRAKLNMMVASPPFGYTHQYEMPTDFLYMVMTGIEEQHQGFAGQVLDSNLYVHGIVNPAGIDKYRIESDADGNLVLLSNDATVSIVYVSDVEDTQRFSKTFVELLARYLAAKISYRLTGNKAERDTQLTIFKEELMDFQSLDSQQGVFDRLEASSFISGML
jgi:hypothetical protein